jgi:DNA ligase 1
MKQMKLQLTPTKPLTPAEFWIKKFKPMLAYNKEFDLRDVRLPCYVSEKIDGIRCIIHEGGIPRTRDNKPIPNDYIRNTIIKAGLPAGFDGEIVTLRVDRTRKSFHGIQSDVMSEDGEPTFEYHVFDYAPNLPTCNLPFDARLFTLELLAKDIKSIPLYVVEQNHCLTDLDFDRCVEQYVDNFNDKYEGYMIRSTTGKYKFGRSTLSEQYLLKVTPWRRTEATIVGFEEELINDDTSTQQKHNLRPANSLGALVCKWEGCQETFRIGSGFTREERAEIWDRRQFYFNKQVTFKYKPYGTKDKPRTPIFVGVRLENV